MGSKAVLVLLYIPMCAHLSNLANVQKLMALLIRNQRTENNFFPIVSTMNIKCLSYGFHIFISSHIAFEVFDV